MSYKVISSEAFEQDLLHYIRYLNRQEPGLGNEFYFLTDELLQQIGENPRHWQVTKFGIRRAHLAKFKKHAIHFVIEEQTVYLVGLYHDHEAPSRWRGKPNS